MNLRRMHKAGNLILFTIVFLLPALCHADRSKGVYPVPVDFYKKKWCAEHQGATEVKTSDGTRADCVTSTHVVEFQFAPKWAETIGRALYYGFETGKKAGIVLVIRDEKDLDAWNRLNSIIEHFNLPIDAWKME
jgi:hypothetical protein